MTSPTENTAESTARKLYAQDRASQSLGMQLGRVAAGVATVQMQVQSHMTNGHGICHGGLIFALADSAFAFACNSHGPAPVAAGVSIEFLAPAKTGDLLTAVAQERWLGKRTGLYDLVVTRTDGTVIAHARGRSHRLRSAPSTTES